VESRQVIVGRAPAGHAVPAGGRPGAAGKERRRRGGRGPNALTDLLTTTLDYPDAVHVVEMRADEVDAVWDLRMGEVRAGEIDRPDVTD
jgi:hypothetical protein